MISSEIIINAMWKIMSFSNIRSKTDLILHWYANTSYTILWIFCMLNGLNENQQNGWRAMRYDFIDIQPHYII